MYKKKSIDIIFKKSRTPACEGTAKEVTYPSDGSNALIISWLKNLSLKIEAELSNALDKRG